MKVQYKDNWGNWHLQDVCVVELEVEIGKHTEMKIEDGTVFFKEKEK